MGNTARCVKMQAQAFESVNMLHWEAIACENSGHWRRHSDRRLETTITFVFATLISMCNVAQ